VPEGDDRDEAYTAIVWGELLSRERNIVAEAETVQRVEGNTGISDKRGGFRSAVVEDLITPERNTSEPGRSRIWPGGDGRAGPRREGEEP
jgi:hypothetical protein